MHISEFAPDTWSLVGADGDISALVGDESTEDHMDVIERRPIIIKAPDMHPARIHMSSKGDQKVQKFIKRRAEISKARDASNGTSR